MLVNMQAEAQEAAGAQEELHRMLLANQANKELKQKQRLEEQALDRKYAREYAEKLDKDEQVSSNPEFLGEKENLKSIQKLCPSDFQQGIMLRGYI